MKFGTCPIMPTRLEEIRSGSPMTAKEKREWHQWIVRRGKQRSEAGKKGAKARHSKNKAVQTISTGMVQQEMRDGTKHALESLAGDAQVEGRK